MNGDKLQLRDGATIQELLDQFKIEPVRVAVELNQTIVSKKAYPTTGLKSGDMVEIVTFVGGG